jgi:hypothetical protein
MAHKTFSASIATSGNVQATPSLLASTNSVFWSDQTGIYRVDSQSSSLTRISDPNSLPLPVGDGVWEEIDAGTDGFSDGASAASTTVDVPRDLIGADAKGVYTEDPTTKDVLEYPTDGSPGAGLGTSIYPSDTGSLLIGPHNALRVVDAAPQPGAPEAIFLENFRLP